MATPSEVNLYMCNTLAHLSSTPRSRLRGGGLADQRLYVCHALHRLLFTLRSLAIMGSVLK